MSSLAFILPQYVEEYQLVGSDDGEDQQHIYKQTLPTPHLAVILQPPAAGLVYYPQGNTMRLIHLSLKEYLPTCTRIEQA